MTVAETGSGPGVSTEVAWPASDRSIVEHTPTEDFMAHALAYTRAGLEVLPLVPGGKLPYRLAPHAKDSASCDPDVVRDWWVQAPEANIGIRPASGVVVVDVDPRDGGASALAALVAEHGHLTPTWTAQTGGGGWVHAWYRSPGPYRKRLALGVDLKGHTGYVVAPPSLHASGRRYSWANELPIAVAPRWLAELAIQPVRTLWSTVHAVVFTGASDDGLVRLVAQAADGERNNVLWWAGWRAAQRGSLASLAPALRAAALGIGLGADEIERTLASAARTAAT